MYEKDYNELLEEAKVTMKKSIKDASRVVNAMVNEAVETGKKQESSKLVALATSAGVMAVALPLKKSHPFLAKTAFLLGTAALAYTVVQMLPCDCEKTNCCNK